MYICKLGFSIIMLKIKFKLFLYYAIALAIEGQGGVVGQIGIKSPQMPLSQNLLYYNGSFPTSIPYPNVNSSVNHFEISKNSSGVRSGNYHNAGYSQNATFNFINKTLGSRPTGICFKEVP